MINKLKLRDLIENELDIQYSNLLEYKLDGEVFFIIDSWDSIKKLMSLQGIDDSDNRVCYRCQQTIGNCQCKESQSPYYQKQNTLDLERLFGLYISDWIFPLNQDDISKIMSMLYTHDLIMSGQTILDESMNPILAMDEWMQTNQVSMETLRRIQDYIKNNPEYDLDELNDWIKDEIPAIEYGFNDEYAICSECSMNSFRISPDSYGWTKSYLDTEYEYICKQCVIDNDLMEDFISECQAKILRGESPKTYPDNIQALNMDEWHTIIHPLDYGQWENGLHYGQKDNPTKQGKYIKSLKLKGFKHCMFDVVFIIYPEQFTISWNTNIRLNPDFIQEYQDNKNRDYNVNWDRLLSNLGKKLYDHTQDRYSPGELYSAALKQNISTRYNNISVNTDTGDINIIGTNDLDEYLSIK